MGFNFGRDAMEQQGGPYLIAFSSSLAVGMSSRGAYLVEVGSDPTLPILAEVCRDAVNIDAVLRTSSR